MATSGSTNFTMTAQELIRDSMNLCGCLEADETPTSGEYELGLRVLNMMVKSFAAEGIHLWTTEELTLFPQYATNSYSTSTWNCAQSASYVSTTLSADVDSGLSTISLTSTTGITAGDVIGIELDDGTMQWTTVVNAATTTITDVLTDSATSGATVRVYTTAANRPLRILSARRQDENDQDTPILVYSRDEYFRLPNKTTTGKVTQIYYDPSRDTGKLYLWPTPDNVDDRIQMTTQRTIEDFDLVSNNPDFPQEWLETLVWNLSERLCVYYSTPLVKTQMISAKAAELKYNAMAWDNEVTSVYFGPEMYP